MEEEYNFSLKRTYVVISGGGGGGNSHIRRTRVLIENFETNH